MDSVFKKKPTLPELHDLGARLQKSGKLDERGKQWLVEQIMSTESTEEEKMSLITTLHLKK